MENKKIDWENLGNSSIKMNLESLLHEQISLRDRILKLSEKLDIAESVLNQSPCFFCLCLIQ
jgi:hypothetical protein